MDTLELIEGKTFAPSTTIEIDGKRFVRCTFDHCRLIYQGTDDLSFEHCTFIQPEWTFEWAAEKVLAFMGDGYEGLGDGGVSSSRCSVPCDVVRYGILRSRS